jgi:ATP synthase protein I
MSNSLLDAIRARRRRAGGRADRSFVQTVALVGAVGWAIVLPAVGGAFLGRLLDRRLGSGILWSAALIGLGAVLGAWTAWRWVWR